MRDLVLARPWLLIVTLATLVACAPTPVASPTVAPAKPAPTAAPAKPAPTVAAKPAATQAPAAKPTEKPAAKPAAFDEKAVADFYKGKTIRLIVGFNPGGGFDLTSRLLARYLPAHIPGNPNVIVENREGAGSAVAANGIYATEPKDGTVIGNFDSSLVLRQALGQAGVSYDAAKFNWLGNVARDATACLARADTGIKTVQDTINGKELILGTLGQGNNSYDAPAVLKATLGANLKLVPGYQGGAKLRLAIESKEADGFCVTFKSAMLVSDRKWLEGPDPFARVIVIMGEKAPDHPLLKGVPAAGTLARSDEHRDLFRTVDAPQLMNKPYAVAPEVPRDRVEALRKALAETFTDPQFLAEATKANMDIDPASGEAVGRVVQEVLSTPQATLEKLKEMVK